LFAPQWSLHAAIRKWNIPLRRVENLEQHTELANLICSLSVDVVISVQFPRILPGALLSQLPVPIVNLHPSLLPAYRGPNPILGMILDETHDQFGGVTLHQITSAVDAGPIFDARPVPFPRDGSLRKWEMEIARAAASLAVDAIPAVTAGRLAPVEQPEAHALYRRATAEELKLTQSTQSRRIAWLCSTVGRVRNLELSICGSGFAITRIVRTLGLPSGRPARIGWWTIETDVADARLVLRRKPLWEGRLRRLNTWALRTFRSA
jgi:methionyl-tRNA formyltransferase